MKIVGGDLDALLAQLDEVDDNLRSLYRTLADDPDLAEERDAVLRDLTAKRRSLAERVGLGLLTHRRNARATTTIMVIEAPSEASTMSGAEEPISAEIVSDDVDGSRVTLPSAESISVLKPVSAPAAVLAPEPPISAEALDEWKQRARTSGIGAKAYKDDFVPTWETTLDKLMRVSGAPRDLDVELGQEIDGLDAVSHEPSIKLWRALPRKVQQLWLTLLAARTRAVRDLRLGAADRGRLRAIMEIARVWAAEHHPGHVHGMNSKHDAETGSWAEDARRHWASLDALLDERPSARKQPHVKKSRPDEASDEARTIDPAWPLWPLVRGRNVLMIGGDPREVNRERLERLFELGSLEWAEPGPRRVQGIVQRIQRRTIDIVVVVKGFVDHAVSEPVVAAAKDAGVAWVIADRYGVVAMKLAFERFLSGDRDAAAGS